MASSSALHRAHIVRRLLAHLAVVLLITLAAVAGLTAPASADDEGGAGTGADGTAAVDAAAGETAAGEAAADTSTETPATEASAPEEAVAEEAAPEPAKADAEDPGQAEPQQAEPATTPKKSAPTARTTTTVSAPTTIETTDSKVWVCKYSRTPSDNEKAQTVNSVAYNENREPGTWGFEDAQGSSYVYGFDTGAASKPTTNDCPILIVPPAAPTWGEPTCASPLGTYVLATYPSTRATVSTSGSLSPGGTFTVTYTVIPPYRFLVTGSTPETTVTFSHTFTTPKNCPVVIDDLPTVDPADPCGTANDTVTLSTSPKYTGIDNGDGTATFTAVAPNVFPGNAATYTVHYTENTDVPCVTVIHPAAPVAQPSTSCDVPWSISVADTDHVGYVISPASSGTEATTVTITATPDATYAFGPTAGWTVNQDGTATYQHTFAAATSCLEVPAAPVPTAPTCFDDGSLSVTVPAHTAVTVNGEQITDTTVYGPGSYDVVYTAEDGYVFSASFVELSSKTYDGITVLAQTGDCVIDVPAQPASLDACNPAGTTTNVAWDTFPTLANIEWSVDQATGLRRRRHREALPAARRQRHHLRRTRRPRRPAVHGLRRPGNPDRPGHRRRRLRPRRQDDHGRHAHRSDLRHPDRHGRDRLREHRRLLGVRGRHPRRPHLPPGAAVTGAGPADLLRRRLPHGDRPRPHHGHRGRRGNHGDHGLRAGHPRGDLHRRDRARVQRRGLRDHGADLLRPHRGGGDRQVCHRRPGTAGLPRCLQPGRHHHQRRLGHLPDAGQHRVVRRPGHRPRSATRCPRTTASSAPHRWTRRSRSPRAARSRAP
ncbi:hypothetical protein [Nocardioides sp. Root140]|uniref:hypothetical protein n=1 Tax=Nocardioides sp. Root140 TaxID=1736460 RepID=UPI0006FD6B94|nr:hypothetical protein [Nocardioides sp. Root140]KQY57037.1 hypothetical protein ASD30_12295 [Nocardioides sp. Root140]